MLSYQSLKYFAVVARFESVSRAAEHLYLNQSGLSTHIRNLENALGVKLFVRTNRNVKLTPAGRKLYEWAGPFFERENTVLRDVKKAAMEGTDGITIGTIGAKITYYLSDYVQSFQDTYGGIPVTVRRMNLGPLNDAIRDRAVDVAFNFLSDTGPENGMLAYHVLERGQIVFAAHKSSSLAKKKSVSLSDLKDVPLAILAESSAAHQKSGLIKACASHGFQPNVVAELDYVEPLLSMVNMGTCVMITSNMAPTNGLDNICYIPMEDAAQIRLAIIWRKDLDNPAAIQFIHHVVKLSKSQEKFHSE